MHSIILVNFGGPRQKEEVRPFLKDIFLDVLPSRLKIFAGTLASLRERHAQKMYDAIGGRSPVVEWTERQARLLQQRSDGIKVDVGMKYGHPNIPEAIAKARNEGATDITLFPLFPYLSRYTSIDNSAPTFRSGTLPRSKDRDYTDQERTRTRAPEFDWHIHPLYIEAQRNIIKDALAKLPDHRPVNTELIFSVHAVPVSSINAGEPYLKQVNQSVSEIMKGFTGYDHHIAFQSATGPVRWTGPSTASVLRRLSTRGPRHLLLIPLGFACENIETLYEIDHVYIPYAKNVLKLCNIARTPALNDNPLFIDLLAELVIKCGK